MFEYLRINLKSSYAQTDLLYIFEFLMSNRVLEQLVDNLTHWPLGDFNYILDE